MPGAVAVGFFGKLPARGDFVRSGLPRAFTDPWDAWAQDALAASQAAMGESWLAAFLEAPVWCFALAPGLCGPRAALGLWLPSVDRAGRYYPLCFAAVTDAMPTDTAAGCWLTACEAAGRAALEQDLGPEGLAALVPEFPDGAAAPPRGSVWWTDGAPRLPAARQNFGAMPPAASFVGMLDAQHHTVEARS